jgi:hypothetical protein
MRRGRRPLELDFYLDLVALDLDFDFRANSLGGMHADHACAQWQLDMTVGSEAF